MVARLIHRLSSSDHHLRRRCPLATTPRRSSPEHAQARGTHGLAWVARPAVLLQQSSRNEVEQAVYALRPAGAWQRMNMGAPMGRLAPGAPLRRLGKKRGRCARIGGRLGGGRGDYSRI